MPDSLVSFEDAEREFINVRALELQKIGVSSTDITVVKQQLHPTTRDQLLIPTNGIDMIPAFVEIRPREMYGEERSKVEIVPVDAIPSYEGARAIAFYGTPMRYRISWDAWEEGDMTLYYDPVEDITSYGLSSDLTFPNGFWPFLIKKTALNVVRIAKVKLALINPSEYTMQKGDIANALFSFEMSIGGQVMDWEREIQKFRNLDLNSQPHLRRTQDELRARDWNNVSRNSPLDYEG